MAARSPAREPSGGRVNVAVAAPEAYRSLAELDQAAGKNLDPLLGALVKVRASQLNGCSFCIDMHTEQARAAGESEQRLDVLPAWQGAGLFTEREQAALALTDAVTLVADRGVGDEVYNWAAQQFGESELAHLLWSIAAINVWNRVSVASGMAPEQR